MKHLSNQKIKEIKRVFENYQGLAPDFQVEQLQSGHINATYKIRNDHQKYILQQINTRVFKNLEDISRNAHEVSCMLIKNNYPHAILCPLEFKNGGFLWENEWRLFPFIEGTQTFEKIESPDQAYEAARFLGEFYRYVKDIDAAKIEDSIPGFLDFSERWNQFETSLKNASQKRLEKAKNEIKQIHQNRLLIEKWEETLPKFPKRLIHADPKISNFLFDKENPHKIKALIDWDTLMMGPILYDFGDMVRSYTNLKNEDDVSAGRSFSEKNYLSLKKGFTDAIGEEMTPEEWAGLDLAGAVVIYVQAIRFLTDYLNEDVYFAIQRPEHNLDRAQNQLQLLTELKDFLKKENELDGQRT